MISRVLLTGAGGYIGSHLGPALLRAGFQLRCLSRQPAPAWSEPAEWLSGDLENPNPGWVRECQTVVHLAGLAHRPRASATDFMAVNTTATLRLADLAAQAAVRQFIYVSSVAAIAQGDEGRIDNLTPARPASPYGRSKRLAEEGLLARAQTDGPCFTLIRPPMVYGRDCPGNLSRILRVLRSGVPLPLGSLHNRRSFVAVDNLVSALVRCCRHPPSKSRIYFINDGEDLSTTQLLRGVVHASGHGRLWPCPSGMLQMLARLPGLGTMRRLTGSLWFSAEDFRRDFQWSAPLSPEEAIRTSFSSPPS